MLLFLFVGQGQRRQPVQHFAGQPQGLAAGGQHVDAAAVGQQRQDRAGQGIEDVLAVVQHQQQARLRGHVGPGRLQGNAHRMRSRGRRAGGEVDHAHAAREAGRGLRGDAQRQCRLAHAARGHDRGQPLAAHRLPQGGQLLLPPDQRHAGQQRQRGWGRGPDRDRHRLARRRRVRRAAAHVGHQAVAAAGDGRDVARLLQVVAQQLAQAGHVHAERVLLDHLARPGAGHQLVAPDHAARAHGQGDQQVHRPAAQRHGAAAGVQQQARLRAQHEAAEGQLARLRLRIGSCGPGLHGGADSGKAPAP